ncbi:MAG TPA: hypothetical protein VNU71_13705 [Burkholderiaceae bacterium]|nr:hypothetical protein [Burkholderiaceae bacterium]
MPRPPSRSPVHLALVIALVGAAGAARAQDVHTESLPTSGMLSLERVRLPQGERVGLVGGSLLFDIGGDWGLGPAVYGAATGRRGGLFVGGVELQHRWGLGRGFTLATGLYAGGGGGASAPVGSGLMLRPAVTLLKDLGPTFQLGLSWSSVRFPSGDIRSNQIGLALGWRQEFEHLTGSGPIPKQALSMSGGLGFDRIEATVSTYRFTDSDRRHISLIGARAERRTSIEGFAWGMEAAAAAQGDAAGYIELLGNAVLSTAPLERLAPSWRVGARLGVGVGGGGNVPTGGGLIAKALGTMEWSPARGWVVGADYGLVRARSGVFAREAKVWLGLYLEPGIDGRPQTAPPEVVRTEWVGALQHHIRIARSDGSLHSLDTIGLKLNRYIGEHVYLTGQAHSAFAGGAGAYSVGLLGIGVSAEPMPSVRIGAEALAGAAGGGGVTSSGGAVTQALTWAAWRPGRIGEWRLGLGASHPLHSGRTEPVVELSWSRSFGMAGS